MCGWINRATILLAVVALAAPICAGEDASGQAEEAGAARGRRRIQDARSWPTSPCVTPSGM